MTKKELLELTEKSSMLMHKICIGEYELNSLKNEFMQVMETIKQEMLKQQKSDLENETKK